jgi:hypothetical protein
MSRRTSMSQVSTVLERVDRMAHTTWALQVTTPVVHRSSMDDDLLDEWLASLSVDEFEHIISYVADL